MPKPTTKNLTTHLSVMLQQLARVLYYITVGAKNQAWGVWNEEFMKTETEFDTMVREWKDE